VKGGITGTCFIACSDAVTRPRFPVIPIGVNVGCIWVVNTDDPLRVGENLHQKYLAGEIMWWFLRITGMWLIKRAVKRAIKRHRKNK
jgi:hypothetical protein